MKETRQQRKNIETGQQGTNKPWERPGQASQNPSDPVPDKKDRDYDYDQANQTS